MSNSIGRFSPASAPAVGAVTTVSDLRHELLRTPVLDGKAHSSLQQILTAPEFAQAVHTPTLWDRWKQEFTQWLAQQIEQIFRAAAQHPTTSQVVFWSVAVAALGFIAFQLFRLWNRRLAPTGPPSPHDLAVVAWSASDWLTAARASAASGDLNRAIHCTYWSGVARLQQEDVLPADLVHTPRELLSALRRPDAAAPLRSLTGAVEKFWYAHHPAADEDWAACLRSLDALGCKLD